MATTVKDLLNRVLTNLGEDEIGSSVTTLTEMYHKQLLGFLNTIKAEVEAAAQWRALQTTSTVTVTAATTSTTISWANERSRVVRVQDAQSEMLIPLVFDTTTAASPFQLQEVDLPWLVYQETLNAGISQSYPVSFALINTAGDVLQLRTFGPASTDRTVQLTLVVPQARFATSDLAVTVSIPTDVLELGTTWYAMEERGEELGESGMFSEQRYRNALDAAAARDTEEQGGMDLVPV